MNRIKKFELLSCIGTIVFGSLLHFVFDWSGNFKPVALIAAVNESTWEHLKLAFWPAFIFSIIGYFIIGKENTSYWFAQMKKFFFMPFLIIVLFYGWLLFFEDNVIYDISIFVVAVIAGHYLAYKLEEYQKWSLKIFSKIMILILLLVFSLFTYFPPKAFLFKDPVSGGYGTKEEIDVYQGIDEALKTEDPTVDRLVVKGGWWASYVPDDQIDAVTKQNEAMKNRVLYYPIRNDDEINVDEETLKIKIVSIDSKEAIISLPINNSMKDKICFSSYGSGEYKQFTLKADIPQDISSCSIDVGSDYTLTFKKATEK